MHTSVDAQQIESQLYDWIAELGPERDQITRDATLEDLDVDSLDLVEIAQLVEQEWGVQLEPADVKDIRTVGQATDLVTSRVTARAA